jgi:hypothetical protein
MSKISIDVELANMRSHNQKMTEMFDKMKASIDEKEKTIQQLLGDNKVQELKKQTFEKE